MAIPSITNQSINLPLNLEGITLAYPLAIQTYETARLRVDAVDNKIQNLITFFATLTAAVPIVTANKGLAFWSPSAMAAFACYILGTGLALYARQTGDLQVLLPSVLYEKWLDLSETDFKADMIYFAGQHFENNRKAINRKAKLADYASMFYLAELTLFALWALRLF